MHQLFRGVFALFTSAAAGPVLAAPPVLTVGFDASIRAEPASGRLVVYLIRDGARVGGPPADGPFWSDPQPMFGVDVSGLAPGGAATIDDGATSFPAPYSSLAPGTYRVQAVMDLHRDDSSWRREPGNLYSEVGTLTVAPGAERPPAVRVSLTRVVGPREWPKAPGVELFEVRSKLLSEFHGRDVMLRAGVVAPTGRAPDRRYAAVYEVPGFGGNASGAIGIARSRGRPGAASPARVLAGAAFWITLDPESGNGHTLFADSANNGPWGRALVEELIPALEAKYPLVPSPEARLLRGHSSGGWSTLWLAVTYPGTFGACWSSSPDPVDFRRFQLPDIYGQKSLYARLDAASPPADPAPIPSYRANGAAVMTNRQENLMEEVLGPDNTSGQQWDSWFAVFGPRNAAGDPAALFDPVTGLIDHAVAETYRPYDIADLLRRDPGRLGPVFRERIRLVVGDQDNFYLNEAVALLKAELDRIPEPASPRATPGYVKIIPGKDHGSVFGTPELQGFTGEMVEHLAQHGLLGAR